MVNISDQSSGTLKPARKWTTWLGFLSGIFAILYIILIFSVFGLIFWEIALWLLIPSVIFLIWSIRRILRVKRKLVLPYRHYFVRFTLIATICFLIFIPIPEIWAPFLGRQFEQTFQEKLGPNYLSTIDAEFTTEFKTRYFSLIDYFRIWDRTDVNVTKNIMYHEYSDSKKVYFDLYQPYNVEANRPAIISIHGGGSLEFTTKDSFDQERLAKYFASHGYVVFCIDYRLAPQGYHFPEMVEDVRRAIVSIKENASRFSINASNIFLWGRSRGGHLATLVAYSGAQNDSYWQANAGNFTAEQLQVRGIIDLYGAVEPALPFEKNWRIIKQANLEIFGVTPEQNQFLYSNSTSKNFVDTNSPPTLIIQGTLDKMVHPEESRNLAAALKSHSVLNIYLEVPFGQHGFDALPSTPGGQLTLYFAERFMGYILSN